MRERWQLDYKQTAGVIQRSTERSTERIEGARDWKQWRAKEVRLERDDCVLMV